MTTGEKLQKLRKDNNYTQEDLADILGVSRQSISKWESDTAFPETDKLVALRKLYKCTVDYLLNDDTEQETIEEKTTPQKSKKVICFLKTLPFAIMTSFFLILGFIIFGIAQFYIGKVENITLYLRPYNLVFFTASTNSFFPNVIFLLTFMLMVINSVFVSLFLSLTTHYFKKPILIFNCIIPVLSILAHSTLCIWGTPIFIWQLLYFIYAFVQFFLREPTIDGEVKKEKSEADIMKEKKKRLLALTIILNIIAGFCIYIIFASIVPQCHKPLHIILPCSIAVLISLPLFIPCYTKISYKKKILFLVIACVYCFISIFVSGILL